MKYCLPGTKYFTWIDSLVFSNTMDKIVLSSFTDEEKTRLRESKKHTQVKTVSKWCIWD